MNYCSRTDPQAHRLMFILTEFREVIDKRQADISGNTGQPFGHHNKKPVPSHPSISDYPTVSETHTTSTHHTLLDQNHFDEMRPSNSQASVSHDPPTPTSASVLQQGISAASNNPAATRSQVPGPSTTHLHTPLEMLNSAYFANYGSPSGSEAQEPMTLPLNSRQNSLDLYMDLSLMSEGAANNMGNELETEVEFEKLWHWPSTSSG